MKLLALHTDKYPLPYDGWVNDLANHGIYVTATNVQLLRFLQPAIVSRKLRHGDFEAIVVTDRSLLKIGQQAAQLAESGLKTSLLPQLPTPALLEIKREQAPDTKTFLYLLHGGDEARKTVMGFASTAPTDAMLRIVGTSKAREIMPVVQLTRKLEVNTRIEWPGDVCNIEKECANCAAFVAGERILTPAEASLCQAGVPCYAPGDFATQILRNDWCTREFHVKQTVNHILALRQL